ncbi:hypothetical protein JMUB7543_28340 [Staphylococcus aureus]
MCIRDRNKGYDVNTNDLVDVTDEFKNKMTYGSNQSVNLDFGDITSAYVLSLIHISEPTRLALISYAVFCLKKSKD